MFYVVNSTGNLSPYELRIERTKEPAARIEKLSPIQRREGQQHPEQKQQHAAEKPPNPYEKLGHLPIKRKRVFSASEIMKSPVVTLPIESSIESAKILFNKKRFRHVPVVSQQEKIVGIISERDLYYSNIEGRNLIDVMSTNVFVANEETSIREIARLMFDERIGCLPILGEDGALVGIVTRSDILETITRQAPLELWA